MSSNIMKQILNTYEFRFVSLILIPIFLIGLSAFVYDNIMFGCLLLLLVVDGIWGLLRNNKYKILEIPKYSLQQLRVIKIKYLPSGNAFMLFGIVFTKHNLTFEAMDKFMIRKIQYTETGYLLSIIIVWVEALYWCIKLLIMRKYNNFMITVKSHICFYQEVTNGSKITDYKNKRINYYWLDFLFNDDDSKTNVELISN